MNTKKENKTSILNRFSNVIANTKTGIASANNIAISRTDEIVTETFDIIEQWQSVAVKAIEGGFKLANNQQELVFNSIESFKEQWNYGKKEIKAIFK